MRERQAHQRDGLLTFQQAVPVSPRHALPGCVALMPYCATRTVPPLQNQPYRQPLDGVCLDICKRVAPGVWRPASIRCCGVEPIC